MSNAFLKRYVLTSDLNEVRVLAALHSQGRSFHNLGAANEKHLSPNETRDVVGIRVVVIIIIMIMKMVMNRFLRNDNEMIMK